MLNNYFTLRYLSSNLDSRLRQKRVGDTFSQTKDTLVVTFQDLPESLIVTCRPDLNAMYLHPRYTRAKANSANVLTSCRERIILSVSVHPADRIVTVMFDGGLALRTHFFGSRANIFLVNEDDTVVEAFRNGRELAGSPYVLGRSSPLPAISRLSDAFQSSASSTLDSILKKTLPHFGSTIVKEALFRCHISPSLSVSNLDSAHVQQLNGVLETLSTELANPLPRIYSDSAHKAAGSTDRFSIIPLHHLEGFNERVFEDIHEAIRVYISRREGTNEFARRKAALLIPLGQYLERTQRSIDALQQDLDTHDRPDRWERFGSLLMAHRDEIHKGMLTATVNADGTNVEVPLDPSLTPLENAQRYFSKAKRSRQAHEEARLRLDQLKSRVLATDRLHSALSEVGNREELKRFMKEHETELDQCGLGQRSEARSLLPFRIFTVDGGFEVLAGKSSANNDLLTMKHAKPNDLWFHARGSSGSHVVLKVASGRGEPSKKAKDQAASIAAYYSKMRGAKLVPVAMTERKYVRKPRGSPPGTVLLEREKVIFARPALPEP